MTTIAYDGRILAADTQVTQDGITVGSQSKISRLSDGRYVALAGAAAAAPAVLEWLEGRAPAPVLKDNEGVSGIVVDPRDPAHPMELESSLRLFPAVVPYVAGSGMIVALTAMHCDRTAAQAVELACRLDNSTGGAVEAIDVWTSTT